MRVVLFQAFPDDYRQSMRVYYDSLREAVRPLLRPGEEISGYLPAALRPTPRPLRYWDQYLRYPMLAPLSQGDVNHVVDQAYGHLLHACDARRSAVTFHDAIALKARKRLTFIQRYNLSAIRKAAAVLCVSEASRKDLLAYLPSAKRRVRVIYEGVHSRFFETAAGDPKRRLSLAEGRYLLHVGHVKFYKNIPALLQVLAILTRQRGLHLKLLRVGGPFSNEQERLIDRFGIRDRIVSLGIVPAERLPDVYRSAELLLLPSLDEGFGFPALEAMASGLPVVASNRGALPEVIGKAGVLVDPADCAAMAKEVESVLTQPGRRQELREAGAQRARQFTWEKTAGETLAVYREIHAGKAGA